MGANQKRMRATISMEPFLLSADEVAAVVGLSRRTILDKVKDGSFPPPVKTTDIRRAWRVTDIDEWVCGLEPAPEAAA